ncbi:hypothetical protein PUNSTDRAFT_113507 [Punctularia strigosozonata HHB-11173 SS5]|uniref:uncharacterized protein n=1 Tax=Punctularia strigosozonata (strain HHB-11173) TaxID=741275 RepID=UPI00044176B3|nr:uncharacterized protein PUNSTDRAFT_113507 [Punctularia strigosozonata HHB-11173 SS5]EIN08907.1 hypothetical protein PUNSTDRAFT_113507 [Punctularia strigosozonata HHB-11173 SS5]
MCPTVTHIACVPSHIGPTFRHLKTNRDRAPRPYEPFASPALFMADVNLVEVTSRNEEFLRVASLSIALYDYLQTLPAEWRFYRAQKSILRPSLACCCFVAIRYVSIAVLVVSNYGFFANNFTQESCRRYYLLAPIFKVLQTIISQAILAIRAFNLSRRNKYVGYGFGALFAVCVVMECFSNTFHRKPWVDASRRNCSATSATHGISAWVFNLFSMTFDFVTLTISSIYLWRYRTPSLSGSMSHLVKMMLYDGLLYFVLLTAINLVNLILYKSVNSGLQVSAYVSLYYAMTWIMSQRIILRLRKASDESGLTESIVFTRKLTTVAAISHAFRSQFESQRKHIDDEFAVVDEDGRVPPHDRSEEFDPEKEAADLDVHVRVERNVTVERSRSAYERESYRRPRVQWDHTWSRSS